MSRPCSERASGFVLSLLKSATAACMVAGHVDRRCKCRLSLMLIGNTGPTDHFRCERLAARRTNPARRSLASRSRILGGTVHGTGGGVTVNGPDESASPLTNRGELNGWPGPCLARTIVRF
jgi:hypothetical protein